MFDLSETLRYQNVFGWSFDHVARLVNNPGRTGVYCAIADEDGVVLVTFKVREPQIQNAERYNLLVVEKASRLGRRREHFTSGESADEQAQQYPGAFRTDPYGGTDGNIISVSGLPSGSADLAVGLLACVYLNTITTGYADMIAAIDGENPWWDELRGKHII